MTTVRALRAAPRRPAARQTAPALLTQAAVLALVCALLLVLTACSGDSDSGSAGSSADERPDAGAAGSADAAPDAAFGKEADNPSSAEREVITTGHATVVAGDPAAAASRLARLVEEAGGRVENRTETAATDDSPGSASMRVRVPADRMTSAVEALSGLGQVENVQVDSEDVTGQTQDLDARIAALTTSTSRLRELMADASNTKGLLQVEQELSERQADLDALTSRRQRLADDVTMSTLDVDLVAEPVAAAQAQGGFMGGLASGWHALVVTAQTLVLVLGVLLPWLLLAGAGFLGWRWWRRHSRPAGAARDDGDEDRPDDGPLAPVGADRPAPQEA